MTATARQAFTFGGRSLSSSPAIQKNAQRLKRGVFVTLEEQLFGHHVHAAVACGAKRYQVFDGVVLHGAGDALAHAVDVVDVQIVGGPALSASVPVTSQNNGLVSPERPLFPHPLSVHASHRASLNGHQRVSPALLCFTRGASFLRPVCEGKLYAAISAFCDFTKRALAFMSAKVAQVNYVCFRASGWAAWHAENLRCAKRGKATAAALAVLVTIAVAGLLAFLHLARSATLNITALALDSDPAACACNRLVFSGDVHLQNVAEAFSNG